LVAEKQYYLLSFLPALEGLGAQPPMSPAAMLDRIDRESSARRLVEAILLSDDLLQREAVLAGELDEPAPAVLSMPQLRDEAPLPDSLQTSSEPTRRVASDALWEQYFRLVARTAEQIGSRFLRQWVGYEVALRNALVEARARALNLEPTDYIVAGDLAETEVDLNAVVNEWAAAGDPMAGQRVLDQARWDWLATHEEYYSFGDDELAAYAARLLLMQRWGRIARQSESSESPGSTTRYSSDARGS
jgi:hypothetical protein